jgi:hypothetical protein
MENEELETRRNSSYLIKYDNYKPIAPERITKIAENLVKGKQGLKVI